MKKLLQVCKFSSFNWRLSVTTIRDSKVHDMPLPDQPGEDRPPRKQSIKEKIKQVSQSKEFEGAKAHTTSWVCRDPHFLPLRSAWWLPVLQRLTTATASRCRCITPTAKERRNLLGFGYMSIIFCGHHVDVLENFVSAYISSDLPIVAFRFCLIAFAFLSTYCTPLMSVIYISSDRKLMQWLVECRLAQTWGVGCAEDFHIVPCSLKKFTVPNKLFLLTCSTPFSFRGLQLKINILNVVKLQNYFA